MKCRDNRNKENKTETLYLETLPFWSLPILSVFGIVDVLACRHFDCRCLKFGGYDV